MNLPVNLLASGWDCLVVGGGTVATRKVGTLLAVGARVHVVSPEVCRQLAELSQQGRITHTARRFEAADVDGTRLVFAATNDRQVNRSVRDACEAGGALCCCVDGNWVDGDFTMPATLQQDGLTVAVSTGGRSCRQARMVKDTLNRHIRSIEDADLLVVGTSHEELSLEARERIQLIGERLDAVGGMLMQVWGIHEFMLLTTCNRIELVAVASRRADESGLIQRILGLDRFEGAPWYRLRGYDAFEHLALVAAGLRSQSPGEYHVAAQVKEALETATTRGWANAMLQSWVGTALHVSKHIKNEVTPRLHAVEIEDLGIAYAVEHMGDDWRDQTVLVLGTGTTGRGLIAKARDRGARCVWCYHTQRPDLDTAWSDRVRLLGLGDMPEQLNTATLIFCALEAPEPVLSDALASRFDPNQSVLIIDLGVPRNVAPGLTEQLPCVERTDLDRLKAWSAHRHGRLDQVITMSRALVSEHRDEYDALIATFQGRNASS